MQVPAYNPTAEPKRPYVRFERRPHETRDPKQPFVDRDWAVTMAPGSRDTSEMPVADWLAWLQKMADEDRLPKSWPRQYAEAYDEWQATQTQPTNGFPLEKWPPLSPGQRAACLAANIRTVEDLAAANAEGLGRIGMGALALKQAAEAWLAEQKGGGALAAKVTELQIALDDATATIKAQAEAIAELKALMPKPVETA